MTSNPAPAEDNRSLLFGLLVAVCLLGFALRLYELSADSLWIDEISTATRSLLDLRSLLRELPTFGVGVELPLHYIVTHIFVLLFGGSEFVLRTPALVFGVLSIPLVYGVGTLLWTRREGLVAALLVSANAYHVTYSQEARHYALLVFLALLSLFLLLKALKHNRASLWAGFALCTTLSLYTHYFAFLFLAAAATFGAAVLLINCLPVAHQARSVAVSDSSHAHRVLSEPLLRFVASFALIALAYLPWLPTLQSLLRSQAGAELAGANLVSAYLSFNFLGEVLTAYTGMGGIAFLLWLAIAVAGLATSGWQASALALLWMGIPFAFFFVVGSDHALHPRYVLFILPLYLLITARGVASISRTLDRRIRTASDGRIGLLMATSGFVVLFALTSAVSLRDHYSGLKEDWRSAARYLADNADPGSLVLVDGRQRGWGDALRVDRGLSYYLERFGATDIALLPVGTDLLPDPGSAASLEKEVWAALWYPGQFEAGDSVIVEHFYRVSVLRLREPSGETVRDTMSMLEVLLHVLPPTAEFDVHLALAELHQQTGSCEQARLSLHRASQVKPEDTKGSEDLRKAVAGWEQVCSG